MTPSLDVDQIVARCRDALDEATPALAVREVLAQLVAQPALLEAALDPVEEGGIQTLHRGPDLTVLRIAWTPGISLNPHEHAMWAVVGLYGGREDNTFFRRSPAGLQPAGGRQLQANDVLVMGKEAIHAVANPRREFAVALHVYGGDFFDATRSEWDPVTFQESPRDLEGTRRLFASANAAWRAQGERH